jgi:RNA polymerase sigma-70 factor (ECF subfamily)
MLEALPRYRPGAAPFQAWLYRIARNLAVDHLRRAMSRETTPLDMELRDNGLSPAALVAQRLESEALAQALRHLPESQGDVLVLRFIAGMPIAEVALALDKSESAVKALQARGLERLQRLLTHRTISYETA